MHSYWTIADWLQGYRQNRIRLDDLWGYVSTLSREDHAWIELASKALIDEQINLLRTQSIADLPLYGVPFAVKDNIDVAGFHTTAACPAFSYLAETDAKAVEKLKAAGAVVIGKTNMDQFATGLVGVRSPYGVVTNSFNPEYISGGSSSGSAVVVAKGCVPFALGSDTAGSGRVPAGLNNIVGLKPTKGWISKQGLVPACRTLDVISIFALHVDDAWQVTQVMQGYDPQDEYSRIHPETTPAMFSKGKIAIPAQLEFYGDTQSQRAFDCAIERAEQLGYKVESIDFTIFNQLANSLYQQAWVAERAVAIDHILDDRSKALPVIQRIIHKAQEFDAQDAMQTEYDRARLSKDIHAILQAFDALMVPTTPTIYTINEVEQDPINKNSHMGSYTNFVNLADLCALALPNVIREDGLPAGVTLIAPAWHDQLLAHFGQIWQQNTCLPLGTSQQNYQTSITIGSKHHIKLAVVGAHLSGMPLNFQLTSRQGVLLEKTHTAPCYQLFELHGSVPPKPGLQRIETGQSIAVEVWEIPMAEFGKIVAEVPPPLGIGNIQLKDGTWVKGFICENYAIELAKNISHFGGWRAYIQSLSVQ